MQARGVTWVTGASAGIGRAVALELARRGHRVVATARRAEELAKLQRESANIFACPGDVTDALGLKTLISRIEAEQGPIRLAFLNAGAYFIEEREKFDASIIRKTFEMNVGGTVSCLEPLIELMRQRGQGQIAINASLAGYAGLPRSYGYAPSKAALINLAEGLALTYKKDGIRFQIVNPGFVRTAMTAKNDFFKMPFLMSPEEAATRICDGFESSKFEITFPRRLAYIFKAARLLPYCLFLPLLRRATGRVQR